MRTDPTHVYYNVRIQNADPAGRDKACSFRETRTVPIVTNPSEYYLSCVRFQIPTSRIPLLVVPVQPYPNTDPTRTIYAVTLSHGGQDSTVWVRWTPNETLAGIPIQPKLPLSAASPFQDASDGYYYCRSYVQMMEMVNLALQQAWDLLVSRPPGALGPPYLTYDAATKLFSFHCDASFDVNAADHISLYFNNDLYALFGAFNHILDTSFVGEKNRQILLSPPAAQSPSPVFEFRQEYSTLVSWVGFRSVVITSGTIPVESEGIPAASPYFSNTNLQATGTPTFLNIISDYDALTNEGYEEFQASIQYTPKGEYRLTDLVGTQPLTSFDISVFWLDAFGGLHPLFIAPNECATFKFMFRKRSFNRG